MLMRSLRREYAVCDGECESQGMMAELFSIEWNSVGCKMVPNNEWYQAPLDVPIFGLKELEESE
jgi:hypothetical protein